MVVSTLAVAATGMFAAAGNACVVLVEPRGLSEPTWSPDGTRVAFVRREDGRPTYVAIRDLRTRTTTRVADGEAPVWSPDGAEVAFQALFPYIAPAGTSTGCMMPPSPTPFQAWQNDVAISRLRGDTIVDVTNTTDAQELPVSWLPNGRIGFEFANSGTNGVATTNPDGSDRRVVHLRPYGAGWSPKGVSWSPTGRKIAYSADNRIYVANADGSEARAVTRYSQNAGQPSWSPDGRKIAFASYGPLAKRGIYVMRSDGTHARRVALGTEPAWSPDGLKLVYVHDVPTPHGSMQWLYVKDLRTPRPGKPLF